MNDSLPLISVIIPTYNAAHFIPEAFASVCAQAYRPLEVLIIDDGSTDHTPNVVAGLPPSDGVTLRCIHQANAGPSAARNRGIQEASGALIAFLDVDDLYPPGKLAAQAARLLSEPALSFVTGRIQYQLLPGSDPLDNPMPNPNDVRPFVNLGAALMRRETFTDAHVGLFADDLRSSEDVDWFFRAMEKGVRFAVMRDVTLLYRRHGENMTRLAGQKAMALSFLRALQRSVERRRAPDGTVTPLPGWHDYFDDDLKALGDPFHV
ncbi:MAG: glycosyltransferase family A protein [bacterium]|nr:glycosyltransferase family A protein [bacterium]